MHKKIEAELVSLANSILQMENKDDVIALHKKAQEIYEKLTVLKFVESALVTSEDTLEEAKPKEKVEETIVLDTIEEETITVTSVEFEEEMEEQVEENDIIFEDDTDEIIEEANEDEVVELEMEDEETIFEFEISTEKVEVVEKTEPASLKLLFEEEFKDAVSADVATSMFEKATKESPVVEKSKEVEVKKKSLNDALFSANIQVGLNDRIAFVKYLFDGSQEDFNRVLSQLNSFKVYEEAIDFINDFVKPDYNWAGKEEYEERLKSLIERKFS